VGEGRRVPARRRVGGSAAYAVTLTGCGERRHLVTAETVPTPERPALM
jgi:hypothetical protein